VSAQVRVGTSGWSYDHWAGVFYPEHLGAAHRLEYYSRQFSTVEIDATFYRLPSENAVKTWHDTVPEGFVFAVKGSRFITHYRRLRDVDEALATYLDRLGALGEKLAVVLWQLPPTFARDDVTLGAFLDLLARSSPDGLRHAVEFRHGSWLDDVVFALLREHGAAIVSVSSDELPECRVATADFVYVRFHGTAAYHGAYERPALEPWAAYLAEHSAAGRDVYAYFNNDAEGHAPSDARRLLGMLENG